MPQFQYKAKDIRGQVFSGVIEAESLDHFYHILRERNQFCIDVSRVGVSSKDITFGSGKLKTKQLSVFFRQFSTMLNSGLPMIKCLDILYQQTVNKRMRTIILNIYESVQRGESLSKAMRLQKTAFPLLSLNMIEAGEASGSLDTVTGRLADQFEKDQKIQNKVTQALVYPTFLVFLSIAVVIFLLVFILPTFLHMFDQFGGTLPPTTQALLAVSGSLTNYWLVYILTIFIIVILWRLLMKNEDIRRGWDHFKLNVPVIGKLLLIVESSRFSRTLASLFSSGMPIMQAIEIVSKIAKNTYIKNGLLRANEDIRRGASISVSIKKQNLFPVMLCSMLNIGEESGNMDEILTKTANYYDEEADTAIQKLISLLEPIMIVVLAIVVGFIVVSIITPIFGIYSQISNGT